MNSDYSATFLYPLDCYHPMKRIYLILLLLIVPAAFAQLDWAVTDMRCGDGELNKFELCEEDVDESRCDELGDILKIATACDTAHCTCVPRVNKAFCGNGNREGVEVCDGEDHCKEYGDMIGLKLECDSDTCGCVILDSVPNDYDPNYLEKLANLTNVTAECGNKILEGSEICDPPNTLCTTSTNEPGVCSAECECKTTEEVDEEEGINESAVIPVPEENKTEQPKEPEPVNITEEPEEEEIGFFAGIWRWMVSIFS